MYIESRESRENEKVKEVHGILLFSPLPKRRHLHIANYLKD